MFMVSAIYWLGPRILKYDTSLGRHNPSIIRTSIQPNLNPSHTLGAPQCYVHLSVTGNCNYGATVPVLLAVVGLCSLETASSVQG